METLVCETYHRILAMLCDRYIYMYDEVLDSIFLPCSHTSMDPVFRDVLDSSTIAEAEPHIMCG